MAMTIGELNEYETENCLLCNLRDTAIGYKELIGGSKAFDKVIKVIEDVMDKIMGVSPRILKSTSDARNIR